MDADELNLLSWSVRNIATKMGIDAVDFKTVNELLVEIQYADPQTRGILTDFMDSHLDWQHFHEKVRAAGQEGQLTDEQQADLALRVGRRNAAREAIVARAAELAAIAAN